MKVLVIGASRGIGLEFVRQYSAGRHAVTATARDEASLERVRSLGAHALQLDIANANSVSALAARIKGAAFDVVVVCAGVGLPLKALEVPSERAFNNVMHTNVLGPMRLMQPIADALAPGAKLALLSSLMGSIGARSEPGNWVYSASKAALNSVLKDASLVFGPRAICVSLHPGWVRTDMGGAGADLDVVESVAGMREVIDGLRHEDTGSFRNFDGASIEW